MEKSPVEVRWFKRSMVGGLLLTVALTIHINVDVPFETIWNLIPTRAELFDDDREQFGLAIPSITERPMFTVDELLEAVRGQASAFGVEVLPDRLRGQYRSGEEVTIEASSDETGYVYLIGIDSDGRAELLTPRPGQDNRLRANEIRPFGSSNAPIRIRGSAGDYRIRAIVTREPIRVESSVNRNKPSGELSAWGQAEATVTVRPTGE